MKLTGTVTRSDVEGGQWLLKTDGGDQYELHGDVSGCKDGAKVELEGKVDKNTMGFGMMGSHFNITKLKTL